MSLPWLCKRLRGRCLLLAAIFMFPASSAYSGGFAIGFNVGADFPDGDDTLGGAGVWHLALDYVPSRRFSLAAEIGTAANETDASRTILVYGEPRSVSLHAVSTFGLVGRYVVRKGRLAPYALAGVDLYTSWDDIRPTPILGGGTVVRSGLGVPLGAGVVAPLSGHWDLYGEALYHIAFAEEDARYTAFQGGVRFHLRSRSKLL